VNADPVAQAVAAARRGELIVFPTDTVYGIAADPADTAATARLFAAKHRPHDLTLPILIASIGDARDVGVLDDRAERLAASLRDPAMLARGVIGLDELRADPGDQRLVADVPAIFLGIGFGLARDHPADIAGPVAAQQESGRLLRRALQRLLDGRHRVHDRSALAVVERGEQGSHLGARAALEFGRGGAALCGERDLVDAAVVL